MMMQALARGALGGLVLATVLATPAAAQQTQRDDLKKEIESLREMLQAIRKDVQEIKGMLARQAGPRSPVNVVIDLANNPFKGERTAKLTLVEFSDYQ